MTFRIQQAAAKPPNNCSAAAATKFPAKPKFFLSWPKFMAKPAYRSRMNVFPKLSKQLFLGSHALRPIPLIHVKFLVEDLEPL